MNTVTLTVKDRSAPPLSALRQRLASDFNEASDWRDLTRRLHDKGYALRVSGGALSLHRETDGTRLCRAARLGQAYASLMHRFHGPFPGHAFPDPAIRSANRMRRLKHGPDEYDMFERY